MWLFLGLIAFYAFYFFGPKPQPRVRSSSHAIETFKEAEQKWNEDKDKKARFLAFAKKMPLLAILYEFMTLFFFFGFIVGCVLDFLFLRIPSFRAHWASRALSPPSGPDWNFSMLFKAVVLYMAWGIFFGIFFGILSGLYRKTVSGDFFMVMHTIILNLLCLLFMVKFVTQAGGTWRDLGLRIPATGFFREVGIGMVTYFGILPIFGMVVVVLFAIAQMLHYEPPPHPLMNVFLERKQSILLMGTSLFLATVIGPVLEEIFFRGFCYPILKKRWGKWSGIILSAVFFAGIHHSSFVFWPIFILGIALAFLYEKRGSLIACMSLHVIHNTVFLTYFFLIKRILIARMAG